MSLRFIIKRHRGDHYSGMNDVGFYTVDAEAPALEAALLRGGTNGTDFDLHSLVGVEIVRPSAAERSGDAEA